VDEGWRALPTTGCALPDVLRVRTEGLVVEDRGGGRALGVCSWFGLRGELGLLRLLRQLAWPDGEESNGAVRASGLDLLTGIRDFIA